MTIWWNSLDGSLQLYWGVALVTSGLLAIQLIISLLGLDHDLDHDADFALDGDAGHDTGVGLLSLRSVTAFFTGFGWGGVAARGSGLGIAMSSLVALAAGIALMAAIVMTMRFLYSLRSSGSLDYRNAIGEVGTVYMTIPANMRGPGQVEVMVQDRLSVIQAMTEEDTPIENRARVRILDIVDSQTLVVEPLLSDKEI